MIAALLLAVAAGLVSGCVLVPVGPPVAEPSIVVPAPVIVAPGHRHYHRHYGYHGGYRRGYGRHW